MENMEGNFPTKFDKRFDNACNRYAKMRKVRRKRKGRKKPKMEFMEMKFNENDEKESL